MLKNTYPKSKSFHSFKCGEIFCIAPAVFNVTCSLCGDNMHLDLFLSHHHLQHFNFTLDEECINLEELKSKRDAKLSKGAILIAIKEEDPEDPIKQEDCLSINDVHERIEDGDSGDNDNDEDEKSLQQLIQEKEIARQDTLQKLETRKTKTRNSKKSLQKEACIQAISQSPEKEIDNASNAADNFSNNEECKNEHEADNVLDDDRDWNITDDDEKDHTSENEKTEDAPTHSCPFCGRKYRIKKSMQKHINSFHNPNKDLEQRKRQDKYSHRCDKCDERFRSARDLRGHQWKHTGIVCDICGKTFTQTGNMMRHKIRHTGIKAHKCKECPKEFFTEKELRSHILCHTGLMPVICEICGKPCRDRGVLTAHMRRHTGERPAKCDVCAKSFFSFHDLNVHAVTHTNLRPFKCDICEATFQRKKALRIHKLIHSKERKHICNICGKAFSQSGGLKSHLRTHDAAEQKSKTEIKKTTTKAIVGLEATSKNLEPATGSMAKTTATEVIMNVSAVQVLQPYVV